MKVSKSLAKYDASSFSGKIKRWIVSVSEASVPLNKEKDDPVNPEI